MIRNVVLAKPKTGYDTAEVERIQQGLRDVNYPVLKEPGLQLLSLAGCQVSRRARGR